jgi:hypothetical protein
MNNDVAHFAHGPRFVLPPWLPAEFLHLPVGDGLVLQALVCRFEATLWQWSISSIGRQDEGQLICSGTTSSVAEARRIAVSEIGKCLSSPIATLEPA